MSYVDDNLLDNEKVLMRGHVHWFVYVYGLFLLVTSTIWLDYILGQFFVVVALFYLLKAFIEQKFTEFAVTDKRLIAKKGFISRNTVELNLSKVESLSVDQGVIGRLLDFGTMTVNGTGGVQTPFRYIAKPLEIRRALNVQIENLKD